MGRDESAPPAPIPLAPPRVPLAQSTRGEGSIRALPLLARLFNIPTFKPSNVQTCFPLSPAFSSDYEMQISQPLSLDIDTKCPGVYAPLFVFPELFNVRTSAVTMCSDLSSFFSNYCELFYFDQKLNSFVFNQFGTLCRKTPGVGGRERQIAKGEWRTAVCPYILTSLCPYFHFPSETASARQEDYQQSPRAAGTVAAVAQAPSPSIPSKYE
jgi:hypothetical protein